jgi:hypothetical protein
MTSFPALIALLAAAPASPVASARTVDGVRAAETARGQARVNADTVAPLHAGVRVARQARAGRVHAADADAVGAIPIGACYRTAPRHEATSTSRSASCI